jgi:hypothetical protein
MSKLLNKTIMRTKILVYALLLSIFSMQAVLIAATPANAEEVLSEQDIAVESRLVITAVQITGGTGKTQEDFIELFNPTPQPFDLNGHRLVKRTAAGTTDILIKAWTEETIVLPYHFYLWANSGFTSISLTPDATSTGTLADNNGIALREGLNDSGLILDSLSWGSTTNGFENLSNINPGTNESLVRTNPFDETAEFIVKPSSPRNSAIILDLIVEPEPTEEPPLEEPPIVEDPPAEEPVIAIKITEILPNPTGTDSGYEQVELYNAGSELVDLEGFKLDDIGANQPLSSNAYVLPSLVIEPESYMAITIPAEGMSLNNTDGDILSLFNPTDVLIDSMFYEETSPEGKSYSYFESGWQWTEPTIGEKNVAIVEEETDEDEEIDDYDNSGLEISEIFPQPDTSGKEFIEIYNSGTEVAQLSKVALYIGDRKKLLPELELEPGDYYVIGQESLPVQLRNSGQIVKLQENTTVISSVEYPMAMINASYAKFEDGFLWTTEVTKSESNILVIPETVKREVASKASKTAVKKPTTPVSKAAAKKTPVKTTVSSPKKTADTKEIEPLKQQEAPEIPIEEDVKKQKESLGKIIAMGAAAVAAGVTALYKLVFTPGVE